MARYAYNALFSVYIFYLERSITSPEVYQICVLYHSFPLFFYINRYPLSKRIDPGRNNQRATRFYLLILFLNQNYHDFLSGNGPFRGKLLLLFLDLKLSTVPAENKRAAGVDVAQKLIGHLWKGGM